ncbi:MAG TPA: protein kinase [Enhygromyxa sp.]|nr:protein kinase [Enhygromyxa sp.]
MNATMPPATQTPATQTQFGLSPLEPRPALLRQRATADPPEPKAAQSEGGTALTIDETDSPWVPQANESDEEGPLRLTLACAPSGPGADVAWQPLADRVRLASGKRVPGTRYRIVRWLGEGGMGMVFEAVHVDIQRPVALKILKPGVAGTGLQRERFVEEARAVASVDSRFVVDVLDFGELPDGRPFYTMELLDPISLYDVLRDGPMPLERALPILRQCCKALAAIHERGMAHRDVKPQNVLIQHEDGRTDAVRIVDFGIASKFCSQPRIAGTAMYMAPEQIRGVNFDGRLDVYALGCVAYELLTGAPPFQGASAAEVVQCHLHEQVKPPSAKLASLPAVLDEVLLTCLAKEPERRFPNMHALEAALCEVQIAVGFTTPWDDLPLPAVSDAERSALRQRMPQLDAPPPRRRFHPRLRMVVAAFVVGLLSATALTSLDNRSEASESQLDEAMRVIAEKTEAARVAGSRAYWAYPPATEPDYPTALRMIDALEREQGSLRYVALTRAGELRQEFAETLLRLGDQYWSAPNGRPFAIEFYAQALMFDDAIERARERVAVTPAQLADIASRATTGELSPVEIEIAEVLRALAEVDPEARRERIEALLADGSPLADSVRFRAQLSELVGAEEPPAEPHPPTPESSGPRKGTTGSKAAGEDSESDAVQAKSYVRRAEGALAKGDRNRAKRYFEKALAHDPNLGSAHAGLAEIHFARGHYQEAMSAAKEAVRTRPSDADLQLLLGDACVKTLRYADARKAYQKAQTLGHGKAAERLQQLAEVTR